MSLATRPRLALSALLVVAAFGGSFALSAGGHEGVHPERPLGRAATPLKSLGDAVRAEALAPATALPGLGAPREVRKASGGGGPAPSPAPSAPVPRKPAPKPAPSPPKRGNDLFDDSG